MRRFGRLLLLCFGFATVAEPTPARSEAEAIQELTVGGLSFAPAAAVTVEPRSVAVGLDAVVFQYGVAVAAPQPTIVELTLKLPTLDLSDPDVSYALPSDDPVNFLAAAVTADGTPVALAFRQTAEHEGRDVTRQLRDAKLPLLPGAALKQRLSAVPPDLLLRIVADGLLKPNGTAADGTQNFVPAWTVATVASGRQLVDPGRTVTVEARLRTSLGASQDTVLRKAVRQQDGMGEQVAALRKSFCVEDALIGGVDKLAGAAPDNTAGLGERRLAVRLPPTGTAAHPALQVTLDKGAPDNLVSTCLTGLRKTGPTTFVRDGSSSLQALPPRLRLLILGRF